MKTITFELAENAERPSQESPDSGLSNEQLDRLGSRRDANIRPSQSAVVECIFIFNCMPQFDNFEF